MFPSPLPHGASDADRGARYADVHANLVALLVGETDAVAAMATVVAELHHAFAAFHWTGFYRTIAHQLLAVGPYQGGHGCTRIPYDRGVCGAAARTAEVQLVPDVVLEHAAGLPPLVRESLVRAEADWPVHTLGRLRARPEPALRWSDAHPLAADWKAWRRDDEEDRLLTLAGGIDLIALRVGNKDQAADRPDVLAVPPDQTFTLYVWWREPRAAVRIDLLHGDEVVWSTPVVEQPGWIRNRLVLDVGDRPASPGMLTVRVHGQDGSVLGQRRFLQWQPDAAAD